MKKFIFLFFTLLFFFSSFPTSYSFKCPPDGTFGKCRKDTTFDYFWCFYDGGQRNCNKKSGGGSDIPTDWYRQ